MRVGVRGEKIEGLHEEEQVRFVKCGLGNDEIVAADVVGVVQVAVASRYSGVTAAQSEKSPSMVIAVGPLAVAISRTPL
jgi:hypothetical protein